jgi:uncharacterized protein YjiS (DUF1127 family)
MSAVATIRALPVREQTITTSRLAWTLGLLARVAGGIAREIRVRRSMRQLAEFDDYMLRDIGVVRADIEGAVRRGHDSSCGGAQDFGHIKPAPSLLPSSPDGQR